MAPNKRKSIDLAPPARLRYLDGVVEYLWDARNLRGLICLVERWSSVEPPTRTGRMFQIRAFLSLKLMDRAWLHLRKLMEDDPSDLAAVSLATEMFLDRGWPSRARKVVAEAEAKHPEDPTVARLRALCDGPPRTPPPNAREIEQHGAVAEVLDLAERFMATGSLLRARALLERIRNTDPTRTRAKDLLWALDGDFDVGDVRPEDLASQLAPTFRDHVQIGAVDLEPPGAEEVTATRIPLEDDDAHEAEFPTLFRRLGLDSLPRTDDDTGEVTQARSMASPEDLQDPASAAADGGIDPQEHRREDTEIMMVIPKGGVEPLDPAEARVHRKRSQDYDLRATLDLQDYRRHMGMSAPSLSDLVTEPDDTEDDAEPVSLEDEDADLVVVTRREEPSRLAGPAASAARPGPMRVIEKHPTPEPEARPEGIPAAPLPPARPAAPAPAPRPSAQAVRSAGASPPRRPVPASARSAPARPAPPPIDDADDDLYLHRRGPCPGLVFAMLAVATLVVLLGWWLWSGVAGLGAGRTAAQAARAIATDRYDALLRVEGDIGRHMPAEGEPADPVLLAAAARVQLALWAGHQPYPERFDETHALVERALEGPAPPAVAHLAAAELAAWEWRVEDAERQLEAYGTEDSAALLVRAVLATVRADTEGAVRFARAATEQESGSERAWRTLAECLLEAGDVDEARVAVEKARGLDADNPRLAIVTLLLDHQAEPATLPADARTMAIDLAQRYTPPRVEALLFEAVARQIPGGPGSAAREWALQQAFAKDNTDPDLLAHFAAQDVGEGHLLDAFKKLQKATHYRPGDLRLRLALVRLLLDLDRIDEARAQLDQARALRPGHPDLALISAWIDVVDSLPGGSPEVHQRVFALLGPYLAAHEEDGEARWILGLAMLGDGQPKALDALTKAAQQLMDSQDPSDRSLVSRALASLVLAGHPGTPRLLDHLARDGARDPWSHLFLAWADLDRGPRARAARQLSQAVEVSPELARAHWERAHFLDTVAHEPAEARSALRRYLALDPSGRRAQEARRSP